MKLDKINIDGKKNSIEVLDKIFSAKINKQLVSNVLYKINANYKGRKVDLNKPKRGEGGRAYVYVNTGKKDSKGRIKVKKVSFGSSMPDAMGKGKAQRKRRKSYGARHNCADKKDKTKPGYWSCRATKFFGRNISGWW